MNIDMSTKITQVLKIETTNDNDEVENTQYMIEKNGEWIQISQEEYEEKFRGE